MNTGIMGVSVIVLIVPGLKDSLVKMYPVVC